MEHCPCLKLLYLCQVQGLHLVRGTRKSLWQNEIQTRDTRASSQGVQLNHLGWFPGSTYTLAQNTEHKIVQYQWTWARGKLLHANIAGIDFKIWIYRYTLNSKENFIYSKDNFILFSFWIFCCCWESNIIKRPKSDSFICT